MAKSKTQNQYEIYIGDKLYTTVTTEGGYSINEISIMLHQDDEDGKLTGFDLSQGFSIKPV
jgi:hypothetical protein